MKVKLSVVMITKNAGELIAQTLESVRKLADEVIVVDDYSTDKTLQVTGKYKAILYLRHEEDYGKQRSYAIARARGRWILIIDSDEIVTDSLRREIKAVIRQETKKPKHSGFFIGFQNHFLGHPLHHGGENYKMLRLFRKKYGVMHPALVHEGVRIKRGEIATLKHKIMHYSYRSIGQMYSKFTRYAIREARQKLQKGESTGLRKIFLYPPHMLYARFIKDRGYKDGFFRLPLDLGFAYMELLTYVSMIFIKREQKLLSLVA